MATPTYPRTARRHYAWSANLAVRAVREATRARSSGVSAVATVVAVHQATAAAQAPTATAAILAEQSIDQAAEALLTSAAFTTSLATFEAMVEDIAADWQFEQLVASLVQDAGRAAEQVATATYRRIGHVRYLNPPSCSRCAVLAGRVYRFSTGFLRHPGCDCVMIPTTLANPDYLRDPVEMAGEGLVTGLSKADMKALEAGADFGQVVNVRLRSAGMATAGRVLRRGSRPTPEAIFRAVGDDREAALAQLARYGYLRS